MPTPPLAHRVCRAFLPVLAGLLCLGLSACQRNHLVQREAFVFGTRVELLSIGSNPEASANAMAEVLREFDRIHRSYHAWEPSDLTRLADVCREGKPYPVSPELDGLLAKARMLSTRSEGLFDPGIGALVRLWGFHTDTFVPRLPDANELARVVAAKPRIGDIQVRDGQAQCSNAAVSPDFGGFAKGWALDRAAAILHERGIHNALINIGGNVMALGKKGDVPWQIGIQDPRGGGAIASLALLDGEAVGTSGDYQRYFELEGHRYSHLIDPRSGRPAEDTHAVTILMPPGPDAGLLSDADSKPIFVAGKDWRQLADKMGVQHVLRVDAEGRIAVTRAMLARLNFPGDHKPDVVVD
ncbi:MAG: FAD:protein FMN transferase [Rhodocyclaceae bacterium]